LSKDSRWETSAEADFLEGLGLLQLGGEDEGIEAALVDDDDLLQMFHLLPLQSLLRPLSMRPPPTFSHTKKRCASCEDERRPPCEGWPSAAKVRIKVKSEK